MAVYERRYDPYLGPRRPLGSRAWVISRFAWEDFSRSRLFLASLVGAAFVPVLGLLVVYLRHNAQALEVLNLPIGDLIPIDGTFFYFLLWPQHWLALWMALVVGPGLITRDLSGAALPLYFSRPLSRESYLFGKAAALMTLLSAVTWLPVLLVWLFQASLDGWAWAGASLDILLSIMVSSLAWTLLLTSLSLAISAWVRWTPVARLFILGLVSVPSAFAMAVFLITERPWGLVLAPMLLVRDLRFGLMEGNLSPVGVAMRGGAPSLPTPWALAALGMWIALGLLALRIRVKALDVVR